MIPTETIYLQLDSKMGIAEPNTSLVHVRSFFKVFFYLI